MTPLEQLRKLEEQLHEAQDTINGFQSGEAMLTGLLQQAQGDIERAQSWVKGALNSELDKFNSNPAEYSGPIPRPPGSEPEMRFVTAYKVTRHYGGPEEGGWYWNLYEILQTMTVNPTHTVDVLVRALKEKYRLTPHGDIYSVRGGVALEVLPESVAGEFQTKETPHYE